MFRKNRLQHLLAGPLGYILAFLLLVIFLFAAFKMVTGSSSKAVLADIKARGTVIIGVMEDMPPYGQIGEGSKERGFEVELASMLGKIVLGGPGVQFFPVNAKTASAYLDNGDCDALIAMMVVNSSNENHYNLSEPYVQEDVSLLCKTGVVPDLHTSGTNIGVIRGSDAKTVLLTYLNTNHYIATVVDIASYPDAVEAISGGRITALCAARSVLDRFATTGISVSPITVGHLNYAIAVRKGEVDLFNALTDALDTVMSDGRLNELYTRYHLSAPIN